MEPQPPLWTLFGACKEQFLKFGVRLVKAIRLLPTGTSAREQAQSKADLFKYCQPGATQATLHPRGACLSAVN